MDIILNRDGDLLINDKGDITVAESVAQKIKIKLGWHEAEWNWDRAEGIPYLEYIFAKDPDIEQIEQIIREKIFEVDEVTEVKDVRVELDVSRRKAKIVFVAYADYEVIKEELEVCQITE